MTHRLTELQATFLKLAVENGWGPTDIARELVEPNRVRSYAKSVGLALEHVRNNFAVSTSKEAYDIAIAEGLIVPSEPSE
jgi:hypothetical protein